MRYRIGFVAIFVACAATLRGQDAMFKVELVPTGAVFAMTEPTLTGDGYVFRVWPDGAAKSLRQSKVRTITRVPTYDTLYKVDLIPSGAITAKDQPTLVGNTYVFHSWRDGTYMSVRKTDMRRISELTGDKAFWVAEGQKGQIEAGHLPGKGGTIIEIDNPTRLESSTQAGPQNARVVGRVRVRTIATNHSSQ
jgi:hypothetical protein